MNPVDNPAYQALNKIPLSSSENHQKESTVPIESPSKTSEIKANTRPNTSNEKSAKHKKGQDVIFLSSHTMPLLEESESLFCHVCNENVISKVSEKIGKGGYILMILLIIFGLFLFAWIPCVCNRCKDCTHHCPGCNNEIGTKKFCCN